MSVNESLYDRAVQHALAIDRYGLGLANRLVRLLNSADKDIVEKLATRLIAIEERGQDMGRTTTKLLEKLLEEIRALNSAVYARLHGELANELHQFAIGEAGFQKAALDSALVVDLATKLPSPARLKAIVEEVPFEGRLLKSWTDGMAQGRMDRISQALRIGMVQGESTDQLVRRIRGSKAAGYADGVLHKSRQSCQSVVRTCVTHVSNATAQQTWKDNDHIVKGWQFVATFDSRTTMTCAGLSGQTFPIGQGPIPPRHIRCRSISVAVTKSYREMGIDRDELTPEKRASMDGQVAGDFTFGDWLRKKGEATQDKMLGPTRAQLFRDGKLDLAQFIKGDGSVLTLDELKAKYRDIVA